MPAWTGHRGSRPVQWLRSKHPTHAAQNVFARRLREARRCFPCLILPAQRRSLCDPQARHTLAVGLFMCAYPFYHKLLEHAGIDIREPPDVGIPALPVLSK